MKKRITLFVFTFSLFFGASPLPAVTLPSIFSDNMVLQQRESVTIWGWGKPYEKISVSGSWSDQVVETETSNHAIWKLQITTPEAGGPYTLTIRGYNEIVLENVLIGEVWLCSGQSNMEWSARLGFDNAEMEASQANYPDIRFFTVEHRTAKDPQIELDGNWKVCTPESMIDFSALAYFFARRLQAELKVPIGLINTSWGGTPAEVWMPEEVIAGDSLLSQAAALMPELSWSPYEPGRVYNAMLAPITQFSIAGVIWYQGETNTANPETYKEMLQALIKSWRTQWGFEFPFYYAQIAPYKYDTPLTGAMVRDAQRRALETPKTGMIVTSDIGNINDIHPGNKQDAGLRLANIALKDYYHAIDQVVNGPLYRMHKVKGKTLRVYFDYGEGLNSRGSEPTLFEIAGADGVYYSAKAVIDGETVVLTSPKVPEPVSVRFAWSNTAEPNLFNGAGLPASCFQAER